MLHLRTLGALDLRGADGHEIRSVLVQPKRLALLVYLALASPRGLQRRDRLLALFWPEQDESRARNALSQALHVLRRGLGEEVLVRRGDEEVGLAEGALECDALTFEMALAEGRREAALAAYRGDLLEGFHPGDVAPEFESWLEEERARLRGRALRAALELAREAEGSGNDALALEWARRAGELAPHEESILLLRTAVLQRLGDRRGALLACEDFAARLERELQVEPSPELLALAADLRAEPGRLRNPLLSRVPVAVPRRPKHRAALAGAVAIVALLLTGARVWWALRADTPTAALATSAFPEAGPSVAVLPFESLGPGPDEATFANGLTEDLITELGRISGLRVPARTSSFALRGESAPADSVARRLGVGHLLTGSVRREGDRVRINVQLVRADNGFQVWAQSYDRELTDILEVQANIARAVAVALRLELVEAGGSPVVASTVDPRAYDLYLAGLEELNERDMNKAVARFEEAVERDSLFARAHAALAYAHAVRPYHDQAVFPLASGRAGRAAADRALALDSTLAEAHLASGVLRVHYDWDFAAGEQEIRRAITLNPSHADAYRWLAQLYSYTLRDEEAIAAVEHAVALDPLSYRIACNVPRILAHGRRNEEAIRMIESNLCTGPGAPAQQPAGSANLAWLGYLYLMCGRHREAAELITAYWREQSHPVAPLMAGAVDDILGARARGERPSADRLRRVEQRMGTYWTLPHLYALAGEPADALRLLEAWYEAHHPELLWLTGPEYDALRPDPRYRDLVRRIGLPINE